ncbi:MAG: hypothetical protein ACPGRD_03030 [Planktomarina sp.]
MTDHILTNLNDTFNSSDSNLGKIEGLRGNDTIVVSGELARQIDGDQGDDRLRGAEVIFGGDGDDFIGDAQIAYGLAGDDSFREDVAEAYGGEGDDWFYMWSGSYADAWKWFRRLLYRGWPPRFGGLGLCRHSA